MSQLVAVALICAASVLAPDCAPETARIVIARPASSSTPAGCLQEGAEAVAEGALGRGIDPGEEYLKISCRRRG